MARNGAKFISKAMPHPGVEVYVNPGMVFGVTSDGDPTEGGSYIHSGSGFCFHVKGEPEWVDHILALWGSEELANGSDDT